MEGRCYLLSINLAFLRRLLLLTISLLCRPWTNTQRLFQGWRHKYNRSKCLRWWFPFRFLEFVEFVERLVHCRNICELYRASQWQYRIWQAIGILRNFNLFPFAQRAAKTCVYCRRHIAIIVQVLHFMQCSIKPEFRLNNLEDDSSGLRIACTIASTSQSRNTYSIHLHYVKRKSVGK